MNYQNEQKHLKGKWITSPVLLSNPLKEVTKGEVVQTNRFATAALDILVMKLLEVQKGSFTKDSYELLQSAILKAIDTKSVEVAQVFSDLIVATGNLQIKKRNEEQHKNSDLPNELRTQNATSVLQKTLQAVVFNVNQFPFEQMTNRSVKQLNQSLQVAMGVDYKKATPEELVSVFTEILQSLIDIQLIKGKNVKNTYNS